MRQRLEYAERNNSNKFMNVRTIVQIIPDSAKYRLHIWVNCVFSSIQIGLRILFHCFGPAFFSPPSRLFPSNSSSSFGAAECVDLIFSRAIGRTADAEWVRIVIHEVQLKQIISFSLSLPAYQREWFTLIFHRTNYWWQIEAFQWTNE